MIRPNKIMYYLEIARAISTRSTCMKNQCGAVIVRDDAIVSTGYNGAPRGRENCIDIGECYRIKNDIPSGRMYEACFPGYTRIATSEGPMALEKYYAKQKDFLLLPRVWSFDVANRKFILQRATATLTRETSLLAHVSTIPAGGISGEFHCTPEHLVLVRQTDKNNGVDYVYREARTLQHGMVMASAYGPDNATMKEMAPCVNAATQHNSAKPVQVYDLTMENPLIPNFCVETQPGYYTIVHNCRSVHGEANAIIDARRQDMLHGTMFIYQQDLLNNCVRKNPGCCQMCQRMIINAGIDEVIFADPDGISVDPKYGYGYRIQRVDDWVVHETDKPTA